MGIDREAQDQGGTVAKHEWSDFSLEQNNLVEMQRLECGLKDAEAGDKNGYHFCRQWGLVIVTMMVVIRRNHILNTLEEEYQ